MKRFRVRITEEAEEDLLDIYRHVAAHDDVANAECLLDGIEAACLSLAATPLRGHAPRELERIGVGVFREIHFKPFRIIYQVIGGDVFIHAVLDGRRSLQSLLERRLLRAGGG